MSTVSPNQVESILPLESGDRLTREEFERRYQAMPGVKKAELIKGVVYAVPPPKFRQHGEKDSYIMGWLTNYAVATPGVDVGDNCTVKLDFENEPQPDGLLLILPKRDGQSRVDENDYIVGAPELVCEIAASSVSYDLHDKLDVYRQNGVWEYVVWRVLDLTVDWFILVGDKYERLPLSSEGWYCSQMFPGLWLDVQSLVTGDFAKVFQVLQQGIASDEHQRFVEELAKRRQPAP